MHTPWDDVYGAVYGSARQALVIVANTSKEPRKNVVWRVKPETLGFQADHIILKDATSGVVRNLPASALTDGSLETA